MKLFQIGVALIGTLSLVAIAPIALADETNSQSAGANPNGQDFGQGIDRQGREAPDSGPVDGPDESILIFPGEPQLAPSGAKVVVGPNSDGGYELVFGEDEGGS